MKKTPTPVNPVEAVTWAATFALKEALNAKLLTDKTAEGIVIRMNEIVAQLFSGEAIGFNTTTGRFEPRKVPKENPTPDVLVIKGASA